MSSATLAQKKKLKSLRRKPKQLSRLPGVWIEPALTRIGNMIVAVRDIHSLSIVEFKGGAHGYRETGQFAFWTAVLKSGKGNGVIGRARLTLQPGERFDRIRRACRHRNLETRKAYRRLWRMLKNNVSYVRPSTIPEIIRWAGTHMPDWKYAWRATIRGRIYQR